MARAAGAAAAAGAAVAAAGGGVVGALVSCASSVELKDKPIRTHEKRTVDLVIKLISSRDIDSSYLSVERRWIVKIGIEDRGFPASEGAPQTNRPGRILVCFGYSMWGFRNKP